MLVRQWLTPVLALAATGHAQVDLAAAVRALTEGPQFAGARVGVCVRDLGSPTILARHDDDRGFMTASNMKLVTAATALLSLGPDFTFVTRLLACGTVHGGVLDGDLVLVGAGDPTLGGRHEPDGPLAPLQRFAHALASQHGIKEVTGAVLGDDDCQPDELMGEGWAWGYEAADYAAQVSGLCFAENVVRLEFLPTAAGRRPGLHLSPETSYVSLTNLVRATDQPTAIDIARERASNRVTITGRVTAERRHRDAVSVDNPTAFAAHALRECLLAAGIRVRGPAADRDQWPAPVAAAARPLAEHRSPPVRDVLVTLNKVSQNLYGEQLVRAAARAATGKSHMRDAAAHAASVLAAHGVDPKGLVIADGSGLTRLNLVQPRQLADLLAAMWRSEHRDVFVGSLPIAGVDGTLADRFAEGPARGRVRAKTGFISRVVALSGYVPRPDAGAAPIVFSVLVNNFTCPPQAAKDAVDAFVQELAHTAGW